MFITERSLSDLKQLSLDEKKMIAKVINTLIDNKGTVLFGSIYDDGRHANFSTTKDPEDTHVIMAIAPAVMGILDPDSTPIKKEELNKEDRLEIQRKENDALRLELDRARNLNKQIGGARPPGGTSV